MKRSESSKASSGIKLSPQTPMYPMLFCTKENLAIAVACKPVVNVKAKSSSDDFVGASWRKGYEIDLTKCAIGQKLFCQKCGEPIDFRLWPSDTVPKIVE